MNNIKVQQGQSVLDVLLQATGGINTLVEFCFLNQISPTETPQVGTTLEYNTLEKTVIKNLFTGTHQVATALLESEQDGIDFMAITTNFIIQ